MELRRFMGLLGSASGGITCGMFCIKPYRFTSLSSTMSMRKLSSTFCSRRWRSAAFDGSFAFSFGVAPCLSSTGWELVSAPVPGMERKEKMYYDPSSLKVFGVAYQSVIFQHKQREDMIRGILRCRSAVTQMKEMENVLRQKIVETQRRYEKFRTHRRNLQEGLRQISPRYGAGPTVVQGAGIRTPLQPLTGNRASPQLALANRDGDPASRRYQDNGRPETVTFAASPESSSADFSFGTPAPSNRSATLTDGSFTPAEQHHAR
uniref:Uncharacterized protein n=1 Tax=Anopheles melas TaxID=34690 RepID=A0A182U5U6_9DIPT